MMINANGVYKVLESKSTYIYNIGDIVSQDNIYINSKMSNKRLMLGFYSMVIFKIVGFKINGNIIWNKGEVQSKRNSTPNRFPGYLKPINVYEHAIIFQKDINKKLETRIIELSPVIKINNKKENTYGHTAPYPIELAELIIPFVKKNYVLDPFLGSGSTLVAMSKHGIKSVGIEINSDYYSLAIDRVEKN